MVMNTFVRLLLLSPLRAASLERRLASIKTRAADLKTTYDYIIVGGGTSGLTVADRLTEDGTKTVLVVEYGPLENDSQTLVPAIGLTNITADMYNYTSIPQPGMNNQTAVLRGGALVGGGSAVNSMYFDRGSAEDYDNWERLGNPGWGWSGIKPYFQKSVTFTPPSIELQTQYNITYDMDAYGGSGPIQASYPLFQWPTSIAQFRGWKSHGVELQQEGADGSAHGLFWIPASLHPTNQTRSYSRVAHYDPVQTRLNYDLITCYYVNTIIFSQDLEAEAVTFQPRFVTNSNSTVKITTVYARREVIIAAGSIQTPLLLQRSGIGPSDLLKQAGISILVDLPGVGNNLQDHSVVTIGYNFTLNPSPNRNQLSANATFMADAMAEWESHKTGPITGCDGDAGVFLPLSAVSSSNLTQIIRAVLSQNPASYLLPAYSTSPVLLTGFIAQRKIILDSYASLKAATIEVPITGNSRTSAILLKPLSRGSIMINTTDPMLPVIDFQVLRNPTDLMINVEAFKLGRAVYLSDSMEPLGPIETTPGFNVRSDADIEAWIHQALLPSSAHPVGTAAMMPEELGGVVGSNLLVHGVRGVSVVDASVMPLIPGTHLSATVYAIAEKAAEIIKSRIGN